MLQQQRADTAAVHVIGDRHGELGRPGAIVGNLVAAAADQLTVQHGEQRDVIRRGLAAQPARLPLGRDRAHAEETQVEVVRGHLGVHVAHRVEVVRPGGPDLNRGPIGQQSVHTGLGLCAHVASPVSVTAHDAALTSIMSYRDAAHWGLRPRIPVPGGQQLAHGHEGVSGVGHGADQAVELPHERGVRLGAAVVREHDAAGGGPPQSLVHVRFRAAAVDPVRPQHDLVAQARAHGQPNAVDAAVRRPTQRGLLAGQLLVVWRGLVHDGAVAAGDLGLVEGGVGGEQRFVVGLGAGVEERGADADGGGNLVGAGGV